MLLKWGGADYTDGGDTLSVTCPQGAKYVGGGGSKYAVTPARINMDDITKDYEKRWNPYLYYNKNIRQYYKIEHRKNKFKI